MKRQGVSVELDDKLSDFSYCEKVLPLELAETLQPAPGGASAQHPFHGGLISSSRGRSTISRALTWPISIQVPRNARSLS